MTYDMSGNIIKAVNTETVMTYSYNKAGPLTGQKDELTGEITEYVYDAAGRHTQMKVSCGQQVSVNVLYRYGKNGELLSENDSAAGVLTPEKSTIY